MNQFGLEYLAIGFLQFSPAISKAGEIILTYLKLSIIIELLAD